MRTDMKNLIIKMLRFCFAFVAVFVSALLIFLFLITENKGTLVEERAMVSWILGIYCGEKHDIEKINSDLSSKEISILTPNMGLMRRLTQEESKKLVQLLQQVEGGYTSTMMRKPDYEIVFKHEEKEMCRMAVYLRQKIIYWGNYIDSWTDTMSDRGSIVYVMPFFVARRIKELIESKPG